MNGPFEIDGEAIVLRLEDVERGALRSVVSLLDSGDDAGGRLVYSAHPEDSDADDRFRELVEGDLDELRESDRVDFGAVVEGSRVTPDQVEAFMRVVGEARLVMANRIGIESDGWEHDARPDDPEVALLGWLGWLQDSAVEVLSGLL